MFYTVPNQPFGPNIEVPQHHLKAQKSLCKAPQPETHHYYGHWIQMLLG